MVATILRLRLTTTMHQLRREWWRKLVLAFGALWALSLLPSVGLAARNLSGQFTEVRADALTALTVVFALGWVVVPVLIAGVDDSLEAGRFASLGLSVRRIMPGLTASALITIPSAFFGVMFFTFGFSWLPDGRVAVAVALAGGLLTVLALVFSARLSVMWISRLLQSRRSREAAFLVVFGGALIVTPLASMAVIDGLESVLTYELPAILESLRHTPVGAQVGAAEAAAAGDWWGVGWRLALSAGWVVVLWWAWRANVAHALVHPIYRGGGARERDDSILASARSRASRAGGARRRLMPLAPAELAVRTRALRYWFSDPRYLAAVISVTVFPFLFFVLVYPAFGSPAWLVFSIPVLLAGTIGWGRHNDVAYDSTALWIDIVSGRLGRDVMRGRVAATLAWAGPLVIVAAVVSVAVAGRFDLAPAVLGACVGVLGTSIAVSAVTSVALPYRAPAPGENPFSAEVGSLGAGLIAQVISSVVAWVVAVPVTLPLAAAVTWDVRWGWVGLVTGTATGVVLLAAGTRIAGDLYNRKSGRLVGAVA